MQHTDAGTTDSNAAWMDNMFTITDGTQTGAIIRCALGRNTTMQAYHGKASITSDGFLICDYSALDGRYHQGAFVGSIDDLERNIAELILYAKPTQQQAEALRTALRAWIATDYRTRSSELFPCSM